MTARTIGKKKRKGTLVRPHSEGRKLTQTEITKATREAVAEAGRCLGTRACESCDLCSLLCPDLCITRDPVTGRAVIDYDYCKACGICAFVCPKGAITMVPEEAESQYEWHATE